MRATRRTLTQPVTGPKALLALSGAAVLAAVIGVAPAPAVSPGGRALTQALPAAVTPPALSVDVLMSGLSIPWDLTFTPDRTMLVTQREGQTLARLPNGSVVPVAMAQSDLWVGSESGLMGIVTDPAFAANRRFYTCQAYRGSGTTPIDIRVLRWVLAADSASAVRSGAPLVTGLPISSGRHGGCRLRFANDGTLHIGTGDATIGTNPQDLGSLGGKTLRVRPDGTIPPDNPFASRGGAAAYVWTYGHRNVQGLAVRPGTSQIWQVEHGPDRDDEVNLLVQGGNYGWDPVPGYDESTSMTDQAKFPSARRSQWSSGYPTVATSGATFLDGSQWGAWEGGLAVAELKGSGVRVLQVNPDARVRSQTLMAALNGTHGRIRTSQLGPDGLLYLTTSNGTDDQVLRVRPTVMPPPSYRRGLDVSPSGVGIALRGTAITVVVRGTDGRLLSTTQSAPGASWSGYAGVGSGTVGSAPAAVSWGGGRMDVFARGTNGHLMHTWTTGSGWARWQDLGGIITAAPAVTSAGSNRLDVIARGTNDGLYHLRWDGARWSPWHALGGIVSSAPAVRDSGSGQVTATAVGRDGRLYDVVVGATGIARDWRSLGRMSSSAPATANAGIVVARNGSTPVQVWGTSGVTLGGELNGAPAAVVRTDRSGLVAGRGLDDALWVWDGRAGHQTWSRVGGALR